MKAGALNLRVTDDVPLRQLTMRAKMKRDREILRLLSGGARVAEAAAAIGLSVHHVNNELMRMRREHGCRTTVQLVCLGLRREWYA